MPLYCVLMDYTDKGKAQIKDAPAINEGNLKKMAAMGVKIIGFYGALGKHDYVAIADCPSDEILKIAQFAIEAAGRVTADAFRIFSLDDWNKLIAKLP